MTKHASHPSTQEAEAGKSPEIQGQCVLCNETLSQKQNKGTKTRGLESWLKILAKLNDMIQTFNPSTHESEES